MASLVQLIFYFFFLAESVSLDQHSHLHNLYIPTVKKTLFFCCNTYFYICANPPSQTNAATLRMAIFSV